MDIVVEKDMNALSRDAWNGLAAKNPSGTIYQTWEWNSVSLQAYGNGRQPWIVSVKDKGQLIAIMPLALFEDNGQKILRFMAAERSDYCELIANCPSQDVYEAVFKYLFSLNGPWDVCLIDNVPPSSGFGPFVKRSPRIKDVSFVSSKVESFALDLADTAFAQKALRKRRVLDYRNHLCHSGRYEILHLTHREEIKPHLDDFFSQHIKRWEKTSWPSLFLQQENQVFYRLLVDGLPEGQIVLSVLKWNDAVLAYHFGLQFNDTLIWYKPSFDPGYSTKSPGQVLLYEVLQFAQTTKKKVFDFGVGKEDYKFRYSNRRSVNETFRIYRHRSGYWKDYLPAALKWRFKRIAQKFSDRFATAKDPE